MSYITSIILHLKAFSIKIRDLTDLSINIDLIGIDASYANALRRIMISEVVQKKHFIGGNRREILSEKAKTGQLNFKKKRFQPWP